MYFGALKYIHKNYHIYISSFFFRSREERWSNDAPCVHGADAGQINDQHASNVFVSHNTDQRSWNLSSQCHHQHYSIYNATQR